MSTTDNHNEYNPNDIATTVGTAIAIMALLLIFLLHLKQPNLKCKNMLA